MSTTKWETNSEDMDDEDLVMEEGEEDEEEEERYGGSYGKTVSPEDLVGNSNISGMSPKFGRTQSDFSRFDMLGGSSPVNWSDAIDEKGESVALMMHLEKTAIHQKFFNNFDDDFDEEDLS